MDSLNVPALSGIGPGTPGTLAPFFAPAGAARRACGCEAGALGEAAAVALTSQMAMTQALMNILLLMLIQLMTGGRPGEALQGLPDRGGTGGGSGGATPGTTGSSGGAGTTTAYDPSAGGSNVTRPNGYDQIVQTFGRPADSSNMVTEQMPAGPGGKMVSVTVHKKIAPKLKAAFEEIKAAGLSDEIKSFDGGYVPRNKRGGSSWSTHAWGIAIDLNASQYPMGTPASKTSPRFKQIAAIMAKYGFYQISSDPMHFQYCTGY